MAKAVGYIRVSTQGQVRYGYSLAFQRDGIMRCCIDNDIELLHIYEDKGVRGAKLRLLLEPRLPAFYSRY